MMRAAQLGVTLIELVTSIVIIGIAVLGLMATIGGIAGDSADPMVQRQATAIAHSYMEEIMLANFCDPDFLLPGMTCKQQCIASACSTGACGGVGGLAEASRDLYDDVCDYGNVPDGSPADRNGTPLSGLSSYTVEIRIRDSGVSVGAPPASSNSGEVVRVDVRVSHPAMDGDVALSAFKANAR